MGRSPEFLWNELVTADASWSSYATPVYYANLSEERRSENDKTSCLYKIFMHRGDLHPCWTSSIETNVFPSPQPQRRR